MLAAVFRSREARLDEWNRRAAGKSASADFREQWWFADAAEVRANDFNLSAGRYRPMSQSAVEHREPRELLDELAAIAVSDSISDAEVGPKHVSLKLLDDFQKDVSEFHPDSPSPALLAFEAHQPAYDEAEFQRMVQRGTAAWSGVPNASEWVEDLRGGRA